MGIYQFNEYIVKKQTQERYLRDCSVVIDGQNYLHNIYEQYKIPFVFGCEADQYAECLKKRLNMYKEANVNCYFVFKGGDTDITKKMKKFHDLVFDVHRNTEFIPPQLLKDTTVQVLHEMGMDYAFCVTEAKDECVALARKLQCPVISFDVEFCFRKADYITSSNLEFDDKTKSIQCRQYQLQNFLQKSSLTKEKAAILVVLTDTTLFPSKFFNALFQTWQVSNKNQMYQLHNIIVWLSKHTEEEARDKIKKYMFKEYNYTKFDEKYREIITNMQNEEPGHVTEYLLNSNIPIVRQDPKWFEKGVVCKHVPPIYINLYNWEVIEGSWVILDAHSQDTLLLSIDIVKYAYNLLTNYSRDKFKVYQDNKYIEIMTYDPNVCRPIYNCKASVFENGWDQVKELKLFEHFLTKNDINTDILAKLEPDCVVLFAALVYFARKKQLEGEDVTREVYAVVMSYVLLNLVFDEDTSSQDWKDNLKVRVAAKYCGYDEDEARIIFDGRAVHRLVELQICIQHMNYLNTLCGSPYESTQYRKVYKGTLIYKMFTEMRDRDFDDFVNELFQMAPTVLAVVKRLILVYHKLLNNE